MTLNTAVNRVANGRRLAARRIVMNTLGSVRCQIWRKSVIYSNDQDQSKPFDKLSFEAISLSQQDEPNYEYKDIGYAYVLADKFNGGVVHKNNSMVNASDLVILAQIEPYDPSLVQREQIFNIPELTLKEGDLLGLMIYEGFIVWYEIVGMQGQTIMADFGVKYVLNRRDELTISPVSDEVQSREI